MTTEPEIDMGEGEVGYVREAKKRLAVGMGIGKGEKEELDELKRKVERVIEGYKNKVEELNVKVGMLSQENKVLKRKLLSFSQQTGEDVFSP